MYHARMRRLAWTMVAVGLASACASAPAKAEEPRPAAATATAPAKDVAPLAWLVGDWQGEDNQLAFRFAGDSLFGVLFTGDATRTRGYTAVIAGRRSDRLELHAFDQRSEQVFALTAPEPGSLTMAHVPTRDTVRMLRDDTALRVLVQPATPVAGDPQDRRLERATLASAPVLEQADRDFGAATAAKGVDGWVEWFDVEGAQWQDGENGAPGKRVEGHEAVRAFMAPVFARPNFRLEWQPTASGFAPAGDLGYTIGSWQAVKLGEGGAREVGRHGAYVTIWKKQADGSWKVLFDTGDPAE